LGLLIPSGSGYLKKSGIKNSGWIRAIEKRQIQRTVGSWYLENQIKIENRDHT
jgi:hypothetical protein